jgi:hypothetical protein
MELFKMQQNRIRGKFATKTHTRLFVSMENSYKNQLEAVRRQMIGFYKMIRFKDERILELENQLKELKNKYSTDYYSNLF